MAGIQALQPQDMRPFGELFAQCEICAMASRLGAEIAEIATRVATAVADFFRAAAQFIAESCSYLGNRVLDLFPNSLAEWVNPTRIRIRLEGELREIIAEEVAHGNENERELLLTQVLPLINQRTERWDKREITRAVAEIPAQEREAILAHARSLITQEFRSIEHLIRAVTATPPQERAAIIAHARPLIIEEMDATEKGKIIRAITAIPAEERETVLGFVRPFCTEGRAPFTWIGRSAMIQAIAAIPSLEREAVLAHARPVMTERLDETEKGQIITTITAIPAEERQGVLDLIPPLITEIMNGTERQSIIAAVAAIPAEEREAVIALALPLITARMNEWVWNRALNTTAIVQAIAAIRAEEREEVLGFARPLITEQMGGIDKGNVITAITAIPAQERETVLDFARPLITARMQGEPRRSIITAITAIPAQEREEALALILPLFVPGMHGRDKGGLIATIAAIPAQDRVGIIAHVRPLIIEGLGHIHAAQIVQAVVAIPAEQRDDVMRHALELITPRMHGQDRAMIIGDVAAIPEDARAGYVRNRRAGFHFGRWNRPAEIDPRRGVNIHEGDRDARTEAAIELLCRHQGPINAQAITQAKNNFIAYLDASTAFTAEQKLLARNALLRPGGVFGPLIQPGPERFVFRGVSGEELIGRLWIFASGLNANEQINAKDGMISALKNSYDDFGGMVCNAGKSQRLVLAVLQGRLAGVNVEGVPQQVTTEQAEDMFFNLDGGAHRNIEALNVLIETANRFCDENPAVNREDFIRRMHEYADVAGIA